MRWAAPCPAPRPPAKSLAVSERAGGEQSPLHHTSERAKRVPWNSSGSSWVPRTSVQDSDFRAPACGHLPSRYVALAQSTSSGKVVTPNRVRNDDSTHTFGHPPRHTTHEVDEVITHTSWPTCLLQCKQRRGPACCGPAYTVERAIALCLATRHTIAGTSVLQRLSAVHAFDAKCLPKPPIGSSGGRRIFGLQALGGGTAFDGPSRSEESQ